MYHDQINDHRGPIPEVVAAAEEVVRAALAAHQGPFIDVSTADLVHSSERDLDALTSSGSLAYPLLADIDARLTVALARGHSPAADDDDTLHLDHATGLLEVLGERRDQICQLETAHQFELRLATGLLALDDLLVAARPTWHIPSFAGSEPERFASFRDKLVPDELAAHEPERTWATRAGQVLERTGGHTRAALCLDWLHVAHQTATPDWATLLAASVLGRYGTVVSLAAPNDAVCLAPAAPARFLAAVTLGRATVMLTDVDDPHEVIDMLLGIALDPVRRDALVTHANGQLDLWRSGQVRHAAPG